MGKYPFDIYGKKILLFATFVVPYACARYYPLLFRSWGGENGGMGCCRGGGGVSAAVLSALAGGGEAL